MVTPGNRVADVGCDHGFVSIYLYERHIAPKVFAMDVRTGPLQRAKEHIEAAGFSEYIETRLSDGVAALAVGEAETLLCAGMGGRLMVKILSQGEDKIRMMKELILQPQSELFFFREYLREHGFSIVQEDMIKEEGKFYPIVKAVPMPGEDSVSFAWPDTWERLPEETKRRLEDSYGPCLLAEKHPVLREYLKTLEQRNRMILSQIDERTGGGGIKEQGKGQRTNRRRQEIEEELADIERCLLLYAG